MSDRSRPELLMPISDEGAALQFFVEAMKQNTAALQQVSKTMQGMQQEQKETLRQITDTRERVIKLESRDHAETIAVLKNDIEKLENEIAGLKSERDHRAGAVQGLNAIIKYGPVIIFFIAAIVLYLKAKGQLG